jgi:hypothetical protein
VKEKKTDGWGDSVKEKEALVSAKKREAKTEAAAEEEDTEMHRCTHILSLFR